MRWACFYLKYYINGITFARNTSLLLPLSAKRCDFGVVYVCGGYVEQCICIYNTYMHMFVLCALQFSKFLECCVSTSWSFAAAIASLCFSHCFPRFGNCLERHYFPVLFLLATTTFVFTSFSESYDIKKNGREKDEKHKRWMNGKHNAKLILEKRRKTGDTQIYINIDVI